MCVCLCVCMHFTCILHTNIRVIEPLLLFANIVFWQRVRDVLRAQLEIGPNGSAYHDYWSNVFHCPNAAKKSTVFCDKVLFFGACRCRCRSMSRTFEPDLKPVRPKRLQSVARIASHFWSERE